MPPKAQAPSLPKRPPIQNELPFSYLLERGAWSEFRRALNTCGLSWNIPDWMCTIICGGPDYSKLLEKDKELGIIFKQKTVTLGEGEESKEVALINQERSSNSLDSLRACVNTSKCQPSIATLVSWSSNQTPSFLLDKRCGHGW